ncbi:MULTISPECIES: nuclear transport factor 2 family protein [Gordonia]|uniref:nuclear transport factor 2 family protein n=1 Tax=Gordonia TaxID=2053 RepID=UPI00374F0CBA
MLIELPRPVAEFFDAVNSRDFDALACCLAEDISYHLAVPHPPVTGRTAVVDALRVSLTAADRVSWEPISHLADHDRTFVERVDRFWFGAHEAAIEVPESSNSPATRSVPSATTPTSTPGGSERPLHSTPVGRQTKETDDRRRPVRWRPTSPAGKVRYWAGDCASERQPPGGTDELRRPA